MTTNDIDKAQILISCKNGEILIGVTDDIVLLNFIAQYVKFVEINNKMVDTINITELIKL